MVRCPCFGGRMKGRILRKEDQTPAINLRISHKSSITSNKKVERKLGKSVSKYDIDAERDDMIFSYRELKTATNDFRQESMIGEGGFGTVYKGKLETTGRIVAVKKLNHYGLQGDKEFLVEILMLSLLRHPNLVSMIGYCADVGQRLLVYEFLPLGSLEDHLHDLKPGSQPLDWNTRMMIAAGAAKGLNFLHNEADPPVIYRDLKSANILLDHGFHPKLSDFGLAKFGPNGNKSHVSTRVMGTEGYCAPEYAGTGKLTVKSDIYSFGVVLLELITGCRPLDLTGGYGHLLFNWARPILKDPRKLLNLADPVLRGQFSKRSIYKAMELALMCLQNDPHSRPGMKDVVEAVNYLASRKYHANAEHTSPNGVEGEKINGFKNLGSLEETSLSARVENRKRAVAEAKRWGRVGVRKDEMAAMIMIRVIAQYKMIDSWDSAAVLVLGFWGRQAE